MCVRTAKLNFNACVLYPFQVSSRAFVVAPGSAVPHRVKAGPGVVIIHPGQHLQYDQIALSINVAHQVPLVMHTTSGSASSIMTVGKAILGTLEKL
jgi:hypothetical protein